MTPRKLFYSKRTLFGTFCGFHRHLTTGETAIALRPFYFAVHPDYFGKHPRQRAVNEASLQRLQAYISCIHTHAIAAPTPLTFYVRNTNLTSNTQNEPRFHEVSLTLTSSDIRETVTSILQKCNLSLNYVKSVPIPEENPPENAKAKFPRPVKWEPSFYSTYGIPDPYGVPCKIKVESILSTWLLKNVPSARLKQAAIEPIRVQVKKLEKTVKDEIGLKEIRWDCGWGISHYRACLISLLRIYLTYMPRIQLKGETLVFGNDTGVCLRGDAILSHDDVANNWINFLRNVYKEKNTLDQLPIAELRLSKLLNNIRVVRKGHHPIILASSYLRELQILTDKLEDYQHSMPKARLYGQYSDIRVRVECVYGPLTICPEGDLIIPTGCSPFMLIDFLYHNSNKIKQIRSSQLRSREEEVSLLADVKQLYQLASITRDVNITWQQMKYCCLRLVSDPRNVDMSLAGCHIKVTSFYSVMSDGEICIPWNWKGYFDNKESDDGL